ncbi:hypothetical protein L6164_021408 [Bauhinia variegata]|uniref:Uncharacterized protein n=1 Tax=Bauhinia variegata TaxID=167791 RepID=A0ACB9MYF5_BAUVA|nr:hypothetical protein L6164_021408 [Bauhinia variegata]
MGGSGRWLKSLISLKKPHINDQEKVDDKSKKKWRLWRSSSEGFGSSMKSMKKGHGAVSERSDSSFAVDDVHTAAMATLVRVPPKDFVVIKQEWAAIRIQAVFRAFLARRALRALRAVVRIQAIFRGRQVRKQAAVTLRCMQALVRVQSRVRARNVRNSPEGKAVQKLLDERRLQIDPVELAEEGWCDIPGTIDEVKAKLQTRQEAAIKRDRAMAYSFTQQQSRRCASPKSRATRPMSPIKHRGPDNKSLGSSLLDRWMAAKPWENRLMEDMYLEPPDMTPMSRKSDNIVLPFPSSYQEHGLVKARKNGVTRRISAAKSLTTSQSTASSSAISSECVYDDSPGSTSYTSASPSLPSSSLLAVEATEERSFCAPSYMNLTESTKAKQRASRCSSQNAKKLLMEDCMSHSGTATYLYGDTSSGSGPGSGSGSDSSVNLWKDHYAPPQRASFQKRHHGR